LASGKNYLTLIFHQELGISLWITSIAIAVMQAKELLRQTGSSIAAISYRLASTTPPISAAFSGAMSANRPACIETQLNKPANAQK